MIIRENYLNTLINSKDKDYIKLLIGVRRSGKSTILKMMKNHLLSIGVLEEQIIEINYELMRFDELRGGKRLHDYINNKIIKGRKTYLFLDKVQEIDEWARVINSIRLTYDIDIYATGSNARMFIGEHLTYLAGRYISIRVYPLSYQEMTKFLNIKDDSINYYSTFLESSFPSVILEKNKDLKLQLNEDIFTSIFERDIVLRGKINKVNEFYQVTRYVLEHIGALISINNITNTLNSSGVKVSHVTISNYIDLLLKSYFLFKVQRYDVKGKEILTTGYKYYVVDFGIRNLIIPNKNTNRGRVLENFVYLELIKKGYKVYIGKIGRDYEIDFVATKDDNTLYIQVSESIIDPQTREREVRPFKSINDNNTRIVVSLDTFIYGDKDYIHLNLFDFLKYI